MIICKSIITDITNQMLLKDSTFCEDTAKVIFTHKTFRRNQRTIDSFFKPVGENNKKRKMSDEGELGQESPRMNGKKRKKVMFNKLKKLALGNESNDMEAESNLLDAATSTPNNIREVATARAVVDGFADDSPILSTQTMRKERTSVREPGYWPARAERDKRRSRSQ